jgi:hypothetical protein
MLKTFALILAAISFITVIGGAVYEHLAVVPIWTAAVPASLTMFQGEYALAAQNFWIPIHPVTLLLLLSALILNWRTARRNYILVGLGGYLLVLIITAVFFVPELMSLTQTTYSQTTDATLTARANNWETYSLIRLGWLIIMAIVLLLGLSKSEANGER